MAESGEIQIDILVNAQQAEQGLADVDQSLGKLSNAAVDAANNLDSFSQDAGKAAKDVSSKLGKGSNDAIKGLDGLKGQAGEVSSSFGQFGAALGLVDPRLASMASQTGALAGGLEGAAKMTKLTGGSMKSLAIKGGLLGVTLGALVFTYKKLKGSLNAANETLAKSNQQMLEGIAKAKAYGARMDALRMKVGLLTQAQLDERESRREAVELMDKHEAQYKRDLEIRSSITTALKRNNDALVQLSGTERTNVHRVVTLDQALEAATDSLETQTNEINSNVKEALSGAEAIARYNEENRAMQSALDSATAGIDRYNSGLSEHNALLDISKALVSGDLDRMREAGFLLSSVGKAKRDAIRVELRRAISLQEEADAAEAAATALENKKTATEAETEAETEAGETLTRRAEALDRIAAATGEAAVINREYKKEIAEINDLLDKGAASEEEAAIMRQGAVKTQIEALNDLKQTNDDTLQAERDRVDQMRALALTERESIVEQFDTQIKELEDARSEDVANKAAYDAKIVALEEEKTERLKALSRAAAEAQIQTANMVTGLVGSLIQAQMDGINQKLDAEKTAALERAGDDLDAQAEIEAEFAARRKKDLAKSWKLQKGLEAANAITSAASASVAALAPPPTGLGPVFGPALIPLIAATLGLQLATIKGQQPTFHAGGVVGGGPGSDQSITAQQGEVVLSRDAVARMGGQAQADAWNAPGGQPGPLVIELTYRQRVFDRVVVDSLAKGGPLKRAINGAAKTGKRGRIGGRL